MSTRTKTELQIESWSNAARVLTISGVTSEGQKFAYNHTTAADRSKIGQKFTLDSDKALFIKTLCILPPAGVRRGECYVRLSLIWTGVSIQRLSSGYVTDGKGIAYPPGVFEGFTDGQGLIRQITGTNPAAGAQITETVPTNARWKFKSFKATLTTDGTVTDRRVSLVLDDGTNQSLLTKAGDVQEATKAYGYNVFENAPADAAEIVDQIRMPLPEATLMQAYRIRTAVANMQAGDDWAAPQIVVEEWIEE